VTERGSRASRAARLTHQRTRRVMPSNATDTDALLALRRSWKFASVCQFLFTFDEVLQLDGFQTQVRIGTLTPATGVGAPAESDELHFMALQSFATVPNEFEDDHVCSHP